jgi:hypothetical protein
MKTIFDTDKILKLVILLLLIINVPLIAQNPTQSLINVNNITSWVRDDGYHDWVVDGFYNGAFPNGTRFGAIFTEGVVWGGLVYDGLTQRVRVNGNTYGTGCSPITRLYRVRPDYLAVDLTSDAASFNRILFLQVTDDDIQELRNQYAKDWAEWPAKGNIHSVYGEQGAPFDDLDGNGLYDPAIDIPGILGASQTIFI